MKAWLDLFRVRNLVTVPGDVIVGAVAIAGFAGGEASVRDWRSLFAACVAGVLMYMFGLADNDIVGVATDPKERPLVSGALTLGAARIARTVVLIAAFGAGALARLPSGWFTAMALLALAVFVYNRTKWCLAMGLCRGVNVLCGAAAVMRGDIPRPGDAMAFAAAAVWTIYIAFVTKYSERETVDPTNGRKVALLVHGLMALQVAAIAGIIWIKSA